MKPTESVLLLDIETFPILGYTWEVYEANVLRVVENKSICGWSAKWLHGKQITKALPDYPGYRPNKRDDRALITELWQLLDDAEVVVAHNGNAFDIKTINARFTKHRLKPPSPFQTVDTLKQARQIAAYDSNRLNDLGKYLDLGEKLRTGGQDLWFDCMAGDKAAWAHMKKYNAQDVLLLEKLYLLLLPWMKSHPNLANGFGPGVCPKCGGTRLISDGWRRNATTAYRRLRCINCGAPIRDTENVIKKEDKPYVAL